MKRGFPVTLLSLVLSLAFAFPPLQPYQQGSLSINLPLSWQIQVDETQGLVYLRENPTDPNSAELFLLTGQRQNNIMPKAMIEQAMQNMKDQGLANMVLIDSQDLPGGLLAVISGDKQGLAYKAAFVSLANEQMISLAGFSALAEHFDELGGAALIFVTVGGQDPANYAGNGWNNNTNNPTTSNPASADDEYCFNPEMDVMYNTHYCRFKRLMLKQQDLDPSFIAGSWTEASAIPTLDTYENTVTGELKEDAMGSGVRLEFHPDGSYEMLWLFSFTNMGCDNSIKAYEKGRWQFDGSLLRLSDGEFQVSSSYCGGEEKSYSGRTKAETDKTAAVDANSIYVQLSCTARDYWQDSVSCNALGENLVLLTRAR